MLRMRSPKPNRRGRFDEKDIPGRLIERYRNRGWTEAGKEEVQEEKGQSANVFDVSGNWFSVRSQVRDLLKVEELPESKEQAVEWLRKAGYEVKGE